MKLLFLKVSGYEKVCELALSSVKISKYHLANVRFLLQCKTPKRKYVSMCLAGEHTKLLQTINICMQIRDLQVALAL